MSTRTRIIFIITILILLGCDTTFKAEKVISKKINNRVEGTYDTYLIKNSPDDSSEEDSLLLSFVREQVKKITKTNTSLDELGFSFYNDVSCTRGYVENYENLKRSEHIMERCEEEYRGAFRYVKIDSNPDIWCLQYPEEIKDTIYCD